MSVEWPQAARTALEVFVSRLDSLAACRYEAVADDILQTLAPFVAAVTEPEPGEEPVSSLSVVITAKRALDAGIWLKFCDIVGISEWAMNEGQVSPDDEFRLTEAQAWELGLVGPRAWSTR